MIEKKDTSDKKIQKIEFQKIAKKQKLQEAGITLIALVVTIIILLILAGVTLNIALSDNGLIKKSQEATEKYKKAQANEEKALSQIEMLLYSEGDYVGEYVTGYEPTSVTIQSTENLLSETTTGSDANTGFKTEDLKWRIWDYDGETLRLISDRPTDDTLRLKGIEGYNNGVHIINEICRQCYTDKNISTDNIEVRNLRRSDIEDVSNYDYTKYKCKLGSWSEVTDNIDDDDLIYYGDIINANQCGLNVKCPAMWDYYDEDWKYKYDDSKKEGIGESSCKIPWEEEYADEIKKGEGSITENTEFKQSYYSHNYEDNEFNNLKYYDLIFKSGKYSDKGAYWLSGRCVAIGSFFGLNNVQLNTKGCVCGSPICMINGIGNDINYALRPFISIDLKSSGYKLVENDNPSEAKFKLTKETE